MTALAHCTLCTRPVDASTSTCACGASIDWLERAPAMLRDKLARGVRRSIGVATVSALVGCESIFCAAIVARDDAYPEDQLHDAGGAPSDAADARAISDSAAADTGADR